MASAFIGKYFPYKYKYLVEDVTYTANRCGMRTLFWMVVHLVLGDGKQVS